MLLTPDICHLLDFSRTKRSTCSLLLAIPLLILATGPVCAQTNPLAVEDAVMPREIAPGSSISFSRDSNFIAYTVTRRHSVSPQLPAKEVPWFAKGADIYVINLITNKEENITGGQGSNWGPVWSPERNLLAFLSDRGSAGEVNLWVWDTEAKTIKMVSSSVATSTNLEWTKDGKGVIFSRLLASRSTAKVTQERVAHSGAASAGTIRLYESVGKSVESAESNPWSLDEYSAELVWVELRSGKIHVIFRGAIGTYKLSPDGSRLAVSIVTRFENAGSQQLLFDVTVLTLTSDQHQLISGVRLGSDGSGFSWSPDSKRLCLRARNENEDTYGYKVADLTTGEVRMLSAPPEPSSKTRRTAPVWDELGHAVYFAHHGELWRGDAVEGTAVAIGRIPERQIGALVAHTDDRLWLVRNEFVLVITHDDNGKQDGVYEVSITTGGSRKLFENGQCYSCVFDTSPLVASRNGQRLVFVSEDSAHSPQLWTADPEFKSLRQLTHLNPQFDSYPMGTARVIDWLSDDGKRLHGALLLPSNYRTGERYPLVVYIYGGVSLSDHFDRFGLAGSGPVNMQLLATRGYAVLLPDAPQHVGTPMLDLAKTILPGVNKAIELGIADPDRLAVMGHSYGGYSTLCLVAQTTRFKAAISIAGDSDLIGFYGEMQDDASAFGVAVTEQGQGAMGATPWERRDRFIENSPFFYFDRIQTPLLIIQGSIDTAVAPFLGDQIFVGLRRLGKETEYARYEGEDHSPSQEWSYDHQVDLAYRMIRWLDSHLK